MKKLQFKTKFFEFKKGIVDYEVAHGQVFVTTVILWMGKSSAVKKSLRDLGGGGKMPT